MDGTTARNHKKEAPAFIAVGNDHLISAQGLIMLLRKAGYTVTNIPCKVPGNSRYWN